MLIAKFLSPTLLLACLLLPAAARADLIGTFKLVGVQVSGSAGSGYLTGSITFDANSNITAESIAFHNTTTNNTFVYTNHSPAVSSATPGAARKDAFSSNSVNVVSRLGQTATSAPVRTYSNLYLNYSLASVTPSSIVYSIAPTSAVDIVTVPTSAPSTFTQFFVTGGSLTLDTPLPTAPAVPPAATPEPTTLLLLSTGILGLAATIRRQRTTP